jgi:hypothetical protein
MKTTKLTSISIALISLMSSFNAQAGIDCSVKAATVKQEVRLPGEGYWMQAVDSNRITFTSHGGTNSKMFDFTTGLQPITRYYDAFPIPPGDIYVHPRAGYSFYKMGDGEFAEPIYNDSDAFSVYQSVGLLPETTGPDYRVLRIAAGWGAGIFQDYKITHSNGNYTFEKVHSGPVKVCRNIPSGGLDTQIPVLSRDGTMIAGRDYTDQMTKIYKITDIKDVNGQRDASCELVQTIPTETSKITFSFDNKKIAFVIADPNTGFGRLIEMNIATGAMTTLSLPNEDVLFMTYRYDQNDSTFRSDDRLLYTRRVGTTSGDAPSDLLLISPNAVVREGDANVARFEALGHLWGQSCGVELDTDYARAVGSRVDKQMCQDLLNDSNLQSLPQEYHSITKAQLTALCMMENRAEPPMTPAIPEALLQSNSVQAIPGLIPETATGETR